MTKQIYEVHVDTDGSQSWYRNDELHREDGPAVIHADGSQSWYRNDELHREDGPAVIRANGSRAWYIDGVQYTEEQFNDWMNPVKELTVAQLEELLGHRVKVVK